MSKGKVETLQWGGTIWISVDDLCEFAKEEKNHLISIKGREFIAPVRCKDCKFCEELSDGHYCYAHEKTHQYPYIIFKVVADDFCSHGEKRDEQSEEH